MLIFTYLYIYINAENLYINIYIFIYKFSSFSNLKSASFYFGRLPASKRVLPGLALPIEECQ